MISIATKRVRKTQRTNAKEYSMPKVKVDFSQAKDFEVLPVGSYPIVVAETEIRNSNSSQFQYINWTLEVETGEHAGRKLWLTSSLNPKATWSLKLVLRALGETSPDLDKDEFDIDPDDYLGRRAIANVTQEEYNGRMQNRVESLSSPLVGASSGNGKAVASLR